jgi:hypothetical protein
VTLQINNWIKALALGIVVFLLDAAPSLAATSQSTPGQVIKPNLWAFGVGFLVPVVVYVLNHVGPWLTEPVKTTVMLIVTTIAGALTELIDKGSVGFDSRTLNFVVTAVIAAVIAHHGVWKPGQVNTALGAGTNRQDKAA